MFVYIRMILLSFLLFYTSFASIKKHDNVDIVLKDQDVAYEKKAADKEELGQDLKFEDSNLTGVNLQGVKLRKANFQEAKLVGVNLQGMKLRKANFQGAKLTGVNLQDAILREVNFHNVKLTGGSLQGADLRSANMQQCEMTGVSLHGANLVDADLKDAKFTKVNLTGVNIKRANIKGASFEKVNLTGAIISKSQVEYLRKYFTDEDIRRCIIVSDAYRENIMDMNHKKVVDERRVIDEKIVVDSTNIKKKNLDVQSKLTIKNSIHDEDNSDIVLTSDLKSNNFILDNNIYYRRNNTNEAVVYIHGRNDNLFHILQQKIDNDLYCLLSSNISKFSDKGATRHRRNWFKGYVPTTVVAPLCVHNLLKVVNYDNRYLLDMMYYDLVYEIKWNLMPLVDSLVEKLRDYKSVRIIGFSQGGMAAHILANAMEQLGKKVDFVISVGSFMITKSNVPTLLINNVNDEVISWKMCLGSAYKFIENSSVDIIEVNSELVHHKWAWNNQCIADLANMSLLSNHSSQGENESQVVEENESQIREVKEVNSQQSTIIARRFISEKVEEIAQKYNYKHKKILVREGKIRYGIGEYLVGFVYYLTYLPALIIGKLIN